MSFSLDTEYMRRLVVEFPRGEIGRLEEGNSFQNIISIEVLHYLRQDKSEFSLLCRIVLRDSDEEGVRQTLSRHQGVTTQVLERERGGAYITFMKGAPGRAPHPGASLLRLGGAYLVALEMNGETVRVSYIGDRPQLAKTLRKLERSGLRHKVVSLSDARFSPDSPLNSLTERQRSVITEAYRLGYYSTPRRISSDDLARRLGIHSSALIAHRRKAEFRLLKGLLSDVTP